ncbi:MAG TPA: GDP-mannose 4,6-dehydratase [Rhodoferax sp.]
MTTTQQKTALITGITGQDGSYLAEFLLEKGYIVHGIKRRAPDFVGVAPSRRRLFESGQNPMHSQRGRSSNRGRHCKAVHYGDLSDTSNLVRIVQETQPDEIYNLGAQSHVAVSFESPEYTADVDGMGTTQYSAPDPVGAAPSLRMNAAPASVGVAPPRRRLFESGQNPMHSQRGRSSHRGHPCKAVNYREAYGMYACNGILFNHESPRRGETFVTRKITRGLAEAKKHALLKHHGYNVNVSVE